MDTIDSMCTCPDSGMIVKQRQELILLTQEVTNQSNKIGNLLERNEKLREKLKVNEKEKHDLEDRIRLFHKEVSHLKGI